MAVIGAIQRNIWIVFVLIFIALVSFLIMDVSGPGGGRGNGPERVEFASIDGLEVTQLEYQQSLDQVFIEYLLNNGQFIPYTTGQYQMDPQVAHQLQEQAWTDLVNKKIMDSRLEAAGMSLSEKEYANLVYGTEPHQLIAGFAPVMQQMAGLDMKQPGATSQFVQGISNPQAWEADPRVRELYENFKLRERTVQREALEAKYSDLMKGSAYVPQWLALREDQMQSTRINLDYVQLRYADVADTDVSEASEVDIDRKYREMLPTFGDQEESRNIEYVAFDVIPTSADTAAKIASLEELKTSWMDEAADSTFALRYSEDRETAWNGFWYNSDLLGSLVRDSAVAESIMGMEADSYTDIFFDKEAGFYRTAKLADRAVYHDSIQVRHIFIAQAIDTVALRNRADSVYNLLATGAATFEELLVNSDDVNTKNIGGEIGWVDPNTPLFPKFRQYVFTDGVPGDPQLIRTLGGFHILDVVERRNPQDFYQLGMLSLQMKPSPETDDAIGDQAQAFLDRYGNDEAFEEGVSENGYQKRISGAFAEGQFNVLGLPGSRGVVTWAYGDEREVGDVEMFTLPNKYIVARLREKRQKGKPELETVRAQVEAELVKEKKGEILLKRFNDAMGTSSSLQELATALGTDLKSAQGASFSGNFIPQVGAEPEVLGKVFGLASGEMSQPIVGNQGVYVVVPTDQLPGNSEQDAADLSRRFTATQTNRYQRLQLINAMKKEAEIVDNHRQFN